MMNATEMVQVTGEHHRIVIKNTNNDLTEHHVIVCVAFCAGGDINLVTSPSDVEKDVDTSLPAVEEDQATLRVDLEENMDILLSNAQEDLATLLADVEEDENVSLPDMEEPLLSETSVSLPQEGRASLST
jgi:hypothetical protein